VDYFVEGFCWAKFSVYVFSSDLLNERIIIKGAQSFSHQLPHIEGRHLG